MTGTQRLALILICLAVAWPTAATAITGWLAAHPTPTFTCAAVLLALPPIARRNRPARSFGRSFGH